MLQKALKDTRVVSCAGKRGSIRVIRKVILSQEAQITGGTCWAVLGSARRRWCRGIWSAGSLWEDTKISQRDGKQSDPVRLNRLWRADFFKIRNMYYFRHLHTFKCWCNFWNTAFESWCRAWNVHSHCKPTSLSIRPTSFIFLKKIQCKAFFNCQSFICL